MSGMTEVTGKYLLNDGRHCNVNQKTDFEIAEQL